MSAPSKPPRNAAAGNVRTHLQPCGCLMTREAAEIAPPLRHTNCRPQAGDDAEPIWSGKTEPPHSVWRTSAMHWAARTQRPRQRSAEWGMEDGRFTCTEPPPILTDNTWLNTHSALTRHTNSSRLTFTHPSRQRADTHLPHSLSVQGAHEEVGNLQTMIRAPQWCEA